MHNIVEKRSREKGRVASSKIIGVGIIITTRFVSRLLVYPIKSSSGKRTS